MIEEKIEINFDEFLSCFGDDGEIKDGYAENAQCCIDAINNVVDRFVSGAETIAHHGLNLHGNGFHAKVDVSVEGGSIALNISRDGFGVLASYIFGTSMNLKLSKSYNMVSIE